MDYYNWRDNVVVSALALSDMTYQRLAWTGAIPTSNGTPEEMLAGLLDDWAFINFAEDNREKLSKDQALQCERLITAAHNHQQFGPVFDGSAERVLGSESWREVVEAARSLYFVLCPK